MIGRCQTIKILVGFSVIRAIVPFSTRPSSSSFRTYTGTTKNTGMHSTKTSVYKAIFNDIYWNMQWYLQDYRTSKDMPVMDHNVVPVYKMGITGNNITVGVVDDGIIADHPDLAPNYLPELSYDFCHLKPDATPDKPYTTSHGTKCAGVIAMVANNTAYGVGIAFNANVVGLKSVCKFKRWSAYGEARSLVHHLKHIDIYSCSWGDEDDGITLPTLPGLANIALHNGITKGRKGKGAIYIFASGNGGQNEDNCSADCYVNHVATIPIASSSQKGRVTDYGERCASIFATAYAGSYKLPEEAIITIDAGERMERFSGTSASAPLASGIIALVLEANPDLTYRDVMHIITMGSEVAPLADNYDTWYRNGAGFWVSSHFGFGLLNAENMVLLAQDWTNVPKKHVCNATYKFESPREFSVGVMRELQFQVDACKGTRNAVFHLEHLELAFFIKYPYRGAISINITSPAGTNTKLVEPRPRDEDTDGYLGHSVLSVHNWGEDPRGSWRVQVFSKAAPKGWKRIYGSKGTIHELNFTLHGTANKPAHFQHLPRSYAGFRLPSGQTNLD